MGIVRKIVGVIKKALSFKKPMQDRASTKKIIVHHAAAKKCTVKQIHQWHLNNGWAGIGYHFLVRKSGKIYEGRPIGKVGAHCTNQNHDSIGICFEGDFTTDIMSQKQLEAGQALIACLVREYGLTMGDVYAHKDFGGTACPGKNFPMAKLKAGTSGLQVGDKVRIKSGAKDINTKKKFSSWVYTTTYTVIRISGDEVVFGIGDKVTGKCHKKYVTEVA